jgi:putative peptidoglycan lipid II flippase
MSKKLLKSTSIVVCMTMLSRVFGFIRDMMTAHLFGAGEMSDAFLVAFRIPNFMRRLFAEGSFAQAFVPILSEYRHAKTEAEIKLFINAMAGTLSAVLMLVTVLGMVFSPVIIHLFAPGFGGTGARFDLAVEMLRITFPYLFLISLTAFSGAILNTYSRYWVPAFTPIFLNLAMISCAIWLAPHCHVPIKALAWGVLIAGMLQFSFQVPFLWQMNLLPKPKINFKDPGVKKVLKLMVPALFGVSVGQINLLLDTLFASFLMVGSVSWLYFSDRLMEFPLGVFGVAISTVILPHLSRHHAGQSKQQFSRTLDWAVRCVLLVGMPAAVVMACLSGPLLSTLFQYGHFTGHSVLMARKSLSAFAIGIVPFMLVKIFASGFYAQQNMRLPVKIGILAMVLNMILATSLSAVVNMSLLLYYLCQQKMYLPDYSWKKFGVRIIFVNVILAMWLYTMSGDMQVWLINSMAWRMMHLAGLLLSGIAIYFTILFVSGFRIKDILIES